NFSTSIFWTTFLQYNTQGNNFNINSRFQWRYKPMSDLFLVYTDNYYTDPLFKNKKRALVLKMNYWLNL
ncbi:MAG: hydrolase, partial [Sphingobacteriales bacterium]|nr:hydrolase [Sphingobacteriales bacterium]